MYWGQFRKFFIDVIYIQPAGEQVFLFADTGFDKLFLVVFIVYFSKQLFERIFQRHQAAIQALPLTLALESSTVIVLDALRKQRNLNDYTGEGVSDALLAECLTQAEALLRHTRNAIGVS